MSFKNRTNKSWAKVCPAFKISNLTTATTCFLGG